MRVFLIAGEASGDRLGAALMTGLKTLAKPEFMGVGGPLMQAEGMTSLFPMEELSVMGLVEILPKYLHLRRRLHQTAKAVLEARPDVLITIDSPDFCLRVARLVKEQSDIRTVHYVAPSVWAWRPKRAKKMANVIDQVLALLPFEPSDMEAAGVACDFVGHPVVTEPQATPSQVADFRMRHGLKEAPTLMVLPGSRQSEVARLGPIFGQAIKQVCATHPDLRLIIPTTGPRTAQVRELISSWPGEPVLVSPEGMKAEGYAIEKESAFGVSDRALAASGTVSLELAASNTPMLIAYDVHWLTREIMRRMLLIDTLTLVNLVTRTRAVPECLGKDCRADLIVPRLNELIEDPGEQPEAMRLTMERLGKGGEAPGLRAAKAVLNRL